MREHPIVTRFAPSPTGALHLGHALAGFQAHEAARKSGGLFRLRIDDLDQDRCRTVFEHGILDDLAWLGLDFDGPVRRQSEHLSAYRAGLERLLSAGFLYPCFCTRSDIARDIQSIAHAPQGPEGPLYPGTCRGLSEGERQMRLRTGQTFAWRLDAGRAGQTAGAVFFSESGLGPHGETGRIAVQPLVLGDAVLGRKEGGVSYHLACVIDDDAQGVNLVTRGEDLFAATHLQRLLQALLGLAAPQYAHHRLVRDDRGNRLAKRDDARAIGAYRARGFRPSDIRALLGLTSRSSPRNA